MIDPNFGTQGCSICSEVSDPDDALEGFVDPEVDDNGCIECHSFIAGTRLAEFTGIGCKSGIEP